MYEPSASKGRLEESTHHRCTELFYYFQGRFGIIPTCLENTTGRIFNKRSIRAKATIVSGGTSTETGVYDAFCCAS